MYLNPSLENWVVQSWRSESHVLDSCKNLLTRFIYSSCQHPIDERGWQKTLHTPYFISVFSDIKIHKHNWLQVCGVVIAVAAYFIEQLRRRRVFIFWFFNSLFYMSCWKTIGRKRWPFKFVVFSLSHVLMCLGGTWS